MTPEVRQMVLNQRNALIEKVAACIRQAWADDYPPELEPANVKGRKEWRRTHLVDLLVDKLGLDDEFRKEAGTP